MLPRAVAGAARARPWLALAFGVGFLLAVQHSTFFFTWSDENIHAYTAGRVAAGEVLYRDVHTARPPLAILPVSAVIALGVGPFAATRIILVLANLLAGIVVLWWAKRAYGRAAGTAACLLFLLSAGIAGEYSYTGMQVVVCCTTAMLAATWAGRSTFAGFAAGAAICAGQHAFPLVVVALLHELSRGRRRVIAFLAGAAATVALVLLPFVLASPSGVWRDLVSHHLYHTEAAVDEQIARLHPHLFLWILDNAPLFFFALAALAVPSAFLHGWPPRRAAAGRNGSDPALFLVAAVLAQTVAVFGIRGGIVMYLWPVLPLLAVLSARFFSPGEFATSLAATEGDSIGTALAKFGRERWLVAGCGLVVVLVSWDAARERNERHDDRPYSFLPVARATETAEMQRMTVADQIADAVQRSPARERPIFGHSTLVAVVALRTGRRIAGGWGDFDPRWFVVGAEDRAAVARRLEEERVEFFLAPNWFFLKDPFMQAYLRRCYRPPVEFPRLDGSGIPRMFLFTHRAGPGPCPLPDRLPDDLPGSDGSRVRRPGIPTGEGPPCRRKGLMPRPRKTGRI